MKPPSAWRDFLATQNTLTLATTNADGSPHACDLFYALGKEGALYFLSDPKTRHIQNLTRAPRVSATVHGAAHAWQEIRGVQIIGVAAHVDDALERARAFARYLAQYPFVRQWLAAPDALGRWIEPLGVADLYKITPQQVRWIDNATGFGYKEKFEWISVTVRSLVKALSAPTRLRFRQWQCDPCPTLRARMGLIAIIRPTIWCFTKL